MIESLAVAATLALPALAQGVVVRRPSMVRLAALARAEDRAIGLLRRLRAAHGDGPLLVPVPGRGWALLPLASRDVRVVLEDRAFTPANREKRGALAHFQPDGVLITPDPELRERRRALNERVLGTSGTDETIGTNGTCGSSGNCGSDGTNGIYRGDGADGICGTGRADGTAGIAVIAEEEAATLPRDGTLTWPLFHAAHWRLARRVVLGDGARHDVTLTRQLDRLRRDANWSWLRGQRTDVRNAFRRRLDGHLARAEPGSLAGTLARTHAAADVHAEGQVPHWLFAYDAGAIASYRALALLTAPPGAPRPEGVPSPERVRAAVLESVRLWPTTLAILRDVTGPTEWDVPEGTMAVIYSPYVNREEPGGSYRPELWLGEGGGAWTGVPFSAGFARCPGEDLVLFTSAALLGALLRERSVRPSRALEDPMPAAFDHFHLRFAVKAADR